MVCDCKRVLGFAFGLIVVMVSSDFKEDFEKFDGKKNFTIWQQRVKDLLVQQRIYKVLIRKRSERISAKD